MSSIAFPHVHYPELGRPLLAAAPRFVVRMDGALHRLGLCGCGSIQAMRGTGQA